MRTKTEAKRRDILDAAAQEFSQRGFHGTTLGHVAARMGSSKATIYNYFRSKHALFGAMLATAAAPAAEALLAEFDPARSFAEGLTAYARRFVLMQASETGVAIQRLVVAEKMSVMVADFIENPSLRIWPEMSRIFEEAQARGALRPGDCGEMARQLCSLLQGDLPMRLLFGERDSFSDAEKEASADGAVRMFLAAYGA